MITQSQPAVPTLPRNRRGSSVQRSLCVGAPPVVLLALLAACASNQVNRSDSQAELGVRSIAQEGETGRFASLARRAHEEESNPVSSSVGLPVPPGVDPALVEPPDGVDGGKSTYSFEQAVAEAGKGDLVEREENPPPVADPGTRSAALRLYASGRAKLLSGEVGAALLDLESASRLDPSAPEIWRELGEAQQLSGKRISATTSFRQAVRRGLREPKTLWQLGRNAQRAGRSEEAVRFLVAARDESPGASDPTLPYLIDADLAEALQALRYDSAAAEMFARALDFPEPFTSGTRLRLEFADLLRRRGDMLRDLGDLCCRLGKYDGAAEAYARSSLSPSLDQTAVLPRLVHVSLRRGRPSEAALTLLENMDASQGLADARTIALIRFLAERTDTGDALAAGLDEVRAGRGASITPSVAGSIARARAAALGPERGRPVLLDHIAGHPDDVQAIAELANSPNLNPGELADQLVGIVRRSPASTPRCADAALAHGGSADPLLDSLAERNDDPAVALRATLTAKLGLRARAADLVIGRRWDGDFRSAGWCVEAVLAGASGRYSDGQAAFDRLRARPDADPRQLSSAALALQRGDESLRVLSIAIDDPGTPDKDKIDLLVTAAGLCLSEGRPRDAEGLLRRAVIADPNDERGYAGLFRLYQPGGALTDQDRLAEVIRSLRESAPSARVLRIAAAQELADRRLDPQAEQLLLGLLEEDISDASAGSLLISVWERRGSPSAGALQPDTLARAEAWVRAKLEAYPEVHWLWAALARVTWARGDAAAAEVILSERYSIRPVDDFAQTRETILRDGLGRRDEADASALARLSQTPRTISASVELVDLLVRLDRRDDALNELRDSVPRTITLTEDQQTSLGVTLARVAAKYADKPVVTDATSCALIEEIASRDVRLAPQLHAFRISVLASRVDDDPEAVRAAVTRGAAQYPALATEMYKAAAVTYLQASKRKSALIFFRLYAEHEETRSPEMILGLVEAVVLEGDADDLSWLFAHISKRSEIETLLKRLSTTQEPRIPADDTRLRAEFAYRIAGELSLRSRPELAHAAYRAALSFDPDHAWSMNDWGYQLLEEGRDLKEAAALIEGAYARLPNEANIIDSIGWVRYNQGVFLDDPGPPAREGAITLFKKAVATPVGAKNATIYDHLGDAAWAAGLHDEALDAWMRAETISAEDLQQVRRNPNAPADFVARISGELDAIRAKVRAARAGETPAIAHRRGT